MARAARIGACTSEKFEQVLPMLSDVLDVERPEGGILLWPDDRRR